MPRPDDRVLVDRAGVTTVGLGLVTDLYELTMAASYLRRNMNGSATFSLFARALPPNRGFLVAAGLDDVLRLLAEYSFDDDDLAWLATQHFDESARGRAPPDSIHG